MRRQVSAFCLGIALAISASAGELTRYALVLTDPAAATQARRADTAGLQIARTRLRTAHETVKAELRSRRVTVTGESFTLVNAVFVTTDIADVDQLKAIAGVRYVAKMPRYHRNLDAAEQLISVPAAWNLLGGVTNAGAGIRIGVIDTGIDSSHPAFQDATLTPPSGFPTCDVTANCVYTNSKVIVARSYVSMIAAGSGTNPAADSRPDDFSARDRVGHGTAVAMAAAGNTNTGPSDTISGVAPKAFLGSYKVFGSPGLIDFTTGDAIIVALEDAFNDGMNIAVLSLGGPAVYGPLDTGSACGFSLGAACDPDAYAVQAAVGAGMLVVAAAGNEGPGLGSLDSPGDAPAAIAAAAVTNGHNWSNGLTVSGIGAFHAQLGDGPAPNGTLTARLSDIASVGDPLGCTAPAASTLSGTIALVQRGNCDFKTKVQSAQAAGAAGVIITNSPGDASQGFGDSTLSPTGLAGATTIPASFVGYTDGQTIRNYLTSNPQATASLSASLVAFASTTGNQMASFSSRGPALNGNVVKPDISAAGTNLYLAAQHYDPNGELYSSSGYVISQGTSFSAPQIAGVGALVLQTNPALTTAQVKSAIVNTATADVTASGVRASVLAAGAGRANAGAAVASTVFASPSSISFGIIRATTTLPLTQAVQLTNTGTASVSLTVAFIRTTSESTAHISVDQPSPQVAPGATTTINFTLSGTTPAAGIYEGFVALQGGNIKLQMPFVYVVPDGVPAKILAVAGNGDIGLVTQQNSEGGLLLQLLDRYGVPVPKVPVTFSVTSGGGSLSNSDQTTDNYGFAGSNDSLGLNPGPNVFTATAGGLSTTFSITASAQPVITPNGAVNAANFVNQPVAPGSYIALFGNNLAAGSSVFSTPYLPVDIGGVSVSFDTPLVSAAGHLWFSAPSQVNVQVPWELQTALQAGQTAAQIKVDDSFNSGAVYNLPLASYSPAYFEGPAGFAAALDQNNQVVTTSNGVAQGTIVQLFLNGLGPVTNQPASGDPSPSDPLARTTADPIVTIGGQNAEVRFSGLTPSTIGLYQINAVVPNTGAGLQPITISIGGVSGTVSHIQVR